MIDNTLRIRLYQGEATHVTFVRYPDGQHNCYLDLEYFNNPKLEIAIDCSIRNWEDLEKLLCIVGALKQADYVIQKVTYYYLFGLRSDRVFAPGMPNYLRDVIAPVINYIKKQTKGRTGILAPHGRASVYLDNVNVILHLEDGFNKFTRKYTMIAGDESAISYSWSLDLFEDSTMHFTKSRHDLDFSISLRTEFLNELYKSDSPILIVDDLCDGGRTFIEEAKFLRSLFPTRKIALFVYHGLFTQGVEVVAEHFDKIYMTNSYQTIEHPKVEMIEVI